MDPVLYLARGQTRNSSEIEVSCAKLFLSRERERVVTMLGSDPAARCSADVPASVAESVPAASRRGGGCSVGLLPGLMLRALDSQVGEEPLSLHSKCAKYSHECLEIKRRARCRRCHTCEIQ